MKKSLFILASVLCFTTIASFPRSWENLIRDAALHRLPLGARVEVLDIKVPVPASTRSRVVAFAPEVPLGLVGIEIESEGENGPQYLQASASIRAFVPVLVASQPISNGQRIDETNSKLEEREISRLAQNGYFLNHGVPRSARGYIGAGQVIGRTNSAPPAVVTQGETVDLVRRKGSLEVRAKVKALQSGLEDQWIQVQNPSSGKLLLARIVGPGEVEVR